MYPTLATLLAFTAGLAGYSWSRNFVRHRLRFVDAVRSPWAPLAAGMAALLVASPLTFLPLVGASAVVLFGIGTALGTASGVRAIRRAESASQHLLH
ncbi:MAG TPA: hypothetical protein VFW66_08105 [Gemmatimonadales bacterium]|nr:hypothetical protein [Gemmatimonadales bacterium]